MIEEAPTYQDLLAGFDLAQLDEHSASVVGLWPDTRIAYVNTAWHRFAAENGGQPDVSRRWGVGSRYLDAVPCAVRPFYEKLLERSLEEADGNGSMRPVSHVYECSSPTLFRRYRLDVYGLERPAGWLLVHTLVVERPHDRPAHAPDDDYVSDEGFVHQCSHCRRVEHQRESRRWDWVPDWVAELPNPVTHTICPVCFDYYYGARLDRF